MTLSIVVQKFGGSILSGIESLNKIAAKIKQAIDLGYTPVVIVSAFNGETNHLLNLCNKAESDGDKSLYTKNQNIDIASEKDVVLSTGETAVSALLAIHLNSIGIASQSLQGWQIPIRTCDNYQNAYVDHIATNVITNLLSSNIVPVISGFQGVDKHNRVTTLGRGGSDITAIALGHALSARRVEIYKEMPGIRTADPKEIKNTQLIFSALGDNIYNMSRYGLKAINPRAAEIALKYNLEVRIMSLYDSNNFTTISNISPAKSLSSNTDQYDNKQVVSNAKQNYKIQEATIECPQVISISQLTNLTGFRYPKEAMRNKTLDDEADYIPNTYLNYKFNQLKTTPIKIFANMAVYNAPDSALINHLKTMGYKAVHPINIVSIHGFGLNQNFDILGNINHIIVQLDLKTIAIEIDSMCICVVMFGAPSSQFVSLLHKTLITHVSNDSAVNELDQT